MSNILTPGLMPNSLTGIQTAFDAGTAGEKSTFQAAVSGAAIVQIAEQSDVVRLTGSAAIKNGAGRLAEVRCESGAAIAITVYDNPAAGSGRAIYSGTLSAGGLAVISEGWAINGMYATISGGSVEFVTTEA